MRQMQRQLHNQLHSQLCRADVGPMAEEMGVDIRKIKMNLQNAS
jgi:hypothetical protein